MGFLPNPHRIAGHRPSEPALGAAAARDAARLLAEIFDDPPTPLRALPALAGRLGLGAIHLKDEGARLGLKSFKASGGAYAVIQLVRDEAQRRLGRPVRPDELPRPVAGTLGSLADTPDGTDATLRIRAGDAGLARIAGSMTFACATDGNHGQSVAAGARLIGARAVVFVHAGVSAERRAAIARFGARMEIVEGSYDDAVAAALQASRLHGWTLLSDTSWPGYTETPKRVMQGYTVMAHELVTQLPAPPTHVFLQAGVGGFAAALAVALTDALRDAAPAVVVVEPARAACLFETAKADLVVRVPEQAPTVMAMLECFEPSLLAWELLRPLAAAFMTVEDHDAIDAMRTLALPDDPAQIVVAGESGAAGLAGLQVACRTPSIRHALRLGPASRVLLFGTESATDAGRFHAAVGVQAQALVARAAAARPPAS